MGAQDRLGVLRPSHAWRVSDAITLCADSWGPEDGPPVLLLHGGGQTRHAWRSSGIALGRLGYRVFAYDARGHGDSSWSPDGDYAEDAFVRDLVRIDELMDWSAPPILIGASLGGLTSMAALGSGAMTATALVLVDVAPRVEHRGVQRIVDFMNRGRAGFGSLEEVAEAVAGYLPHRRRPASPEGLVKNVRLDDDGRYRWHWDPALEPERDLDALRVRLESAARGIDVPTLVVRGALSNVLLEDGVRDLVGLIPHADWVEVEGAAHMVTGDDNAVFIDAIRGFLSQVAPAGDPT